MPTPERLKKIKQVAAQRQKNFAVVLEDVHDPHNAEAVFRTCDAFGVQDVYLIFDKQPAYDPKQIGKSSSSSANKWIDFHIFHSTQECLEALKKKGYTLCATTLSDKSIPIFDADLTHDTIAILLGNERNGLSQKSIAMSDIELSIPMAGLTQSLNISVSAAICMFEVVRQRQKAGDYTYGLTAQEHLIHDFLHR